MIRKWIRFLIRQIYTSSTKSTYFWLIQTFLIRNHSYKRFQIKLDLNELSRYDMICILLSLSCLWQVFFKYICSFFARNFVVGFMLQCFYVCTHFLITPFSEVEICPKVFNRPKFHFSEVYFFQTWYFSGELMYRINSLVERFYQEKIIECRPNWMWAI